MAGPGPRGRPYAGRVLLAWDTSTDLVTVALHDGTHLVAHRTGAGQRRHAEVLSPLIGDVLASAGVRPDMLEALVAGVGPGAYTGLRVGLVTAEALALAWGVPLRGACSLDAMAVQAVAEQPHRYPSGLVVVVDARRQQVFWACYGADGARVSGPGVAAPADVPHRDRPAVGSGALAHPQLFPAAHEPAHPDAGWLAAGVADGTIVPEPPVPMYLRQPDVVRGGGRKSVLQPTASPGRAP